MVARFRAAELPMASVPLPPPVIPPCRNSRRLALASPINQLHGRKSPPPSPPGRRLSRVHSASRWKNTLAGRRPARRSMQALSETIAALIGLRGPVISQRGLPLWANVPNDLYAGSACAPDIGRKRRAQHRLAYSGGLQAHQEFARRRFRLGIPSPQQRIPPGIQGAGGKEAAGFRTSGGVR